MDLHVDSFQAGNIKRIRQACASCRRKKTKCSGERPVCFHCRRHNRTCVYEPYSATVADQPSASGAAADNAELLRRISTIESKLAELSGRALQHPGSSVYSAEAQDPRISPQNSERLSVDLSDHSSSPPSSIVPYNTFPPIPVIHSLIDTYFLHVHNQPYSYFEESWFRQRLENNLLPRCLVLAVLASAVRFSTHEYYVGRTHEAVESFAKESWHAILTEHLTVEENMNLHVIQAVNLLAILEYTAGRVRSGWLKIGLAARISQGLQLMKEPDSSLPYIEQEERRRAFWSAYLVDKLISCGQSRPLAILDEDCEVQLPCDERTFRAGEWKRTPTLGQLLSWNNDVPESPSPFALTILMASIFGRVTRYVHRKSATDDIPPWDTKSEFASITSSLLFVETYSKIGVRSISDVVNETIHPDGTIDHQQVGHLVFARALFHLCHALLNHPFCLRLKLKLFGPKTPASFLARALHGSREYAQQLLDLLQDATESGCFVESSFYAYCVAVAGGIHSLYSHFDAQNGRQEKSNALAYFEQSTIALDRLGRIWHHASVMAVQLRDFNMQSYHFTSLVDPTRQTFDLDPDSERLLWSMVDYDKLGSPGQQKFSPPNFSFSSLPSPASWALNPDVLAGASPRSLHPATDTFNAGAPGFRLNDLDHIFSRDSPNNSGLV